METRQLIKDTSQNLAGMLGIKEVVLAKVIAWNVNRVPYQEREDIAQALAIKLLETKPNSPKLAFAICKNWVANWWKAYSYRQHYSLDADVDDGEGDTTTFGELLVGEVAFENKVCDKIEADRIWVALPEQIQGIVNKRLNGRGLTSTERSQLNRYLKTNPMILAHSI